MKSLRLALTAGFIALASFAFAGSEVQTQQGPSSSDEKNSTEIFNYETLYTGNSDYKDYRGKFGDSDSLYNDISYAHRFLITGNWYLRLGVEYERFDFGGDNGSNRLAVPGCLTCGITGNNNGLPDHLQTVHALVAYEYIFKDHAGAGIELDPGIYFEDHANGDAFDIPWKVWVTFPLKKDKIFAVIGAGGAINSNPIAAPGGGLIWLFTDHLRLEGVFPKPALVYNPNDDWEFRIAGNLYYASFRTDNVYTPAQKLVVHDPVVQYSEDRAGFQATYSHFKPIDITLDVGCTIRREFDFFRAEASVKTDPAPYVRLAVEAKF
jgi:hypothetical protein